LKQDEQPVGTIKEHVKKRVLRSSRGGAFFLPLNIEVWFLPIPKCSLPC